MIISRVTGSIINRISSICLAHFAIVVTVFFISSAFYLGNVFFSTTSIAGEMETVELETGNFGAAPEIKYNDENGRTIALNINDINKNSSGNRLTILHFWATWCVPCVDELPQIDYAAEIFGKKIIVLPIALDGNNSAKVGKFFKEHKINNLPILLDPTAKTSKTAGLKGLPGTLFINNKNQIIAIARGPLDWQRKEVVKFIENY